MCLYICMCGMALRATLCVSPNLFVNRTYWWR